MRQTLFLKRLPLNEDYNNLQASKFTLQTSSKLSETIKVRFFFKSGHKEVGTVYSFKGRNKHRIPGAESGRGTLTTFRLPKESVRPTDFPRRALEGVPGVVNPGAGEAEGKEVPGSSPVTRARLAAAPAKVVPTPRQRERAGPGSVPRRGTKVGLTPSATSRGSRRPGQPAEQPPIPLGPRARRVGEGTSPAAPPPHALPGTC